MPFLSSARGSFGPQGRFGARRAVVATGGTLTSANGYVTHTFNSNGTFTLTSVPGGTTFDYLMVAGGGGGGAGNGNNSSHPAGGAGGLIYRSGESLSAGTYTVVVGTGGAGTPASTNTSSAQQNGANGNNTTFNGLTALGGGGGTGRKCCENPGSLASPGGSGGGAQHADDATIRTGGAATQPGSASGGFGSKGGDGPTSSGGSPCWVGGGGGGAGAAGTQGAATNNAFANVGVGGIGRQYDISGVSKYYAGGGSGGTNQATNCACYMGNPGALGGGGNGYGGVSCGQSPERFRSGGDGHGNLGGGGGGATSGTDSFISIGGLRGGNGGKGVVLIRYQGNALAAPQSVPGLQVWLDASDVSNFSLGGGNSVTTWLDKSGNGHNATGNNSPVYVSNVQNGKGVVRFVNSSEQSLTNTEMQHARERTVFIVRKFNNVSQGRATFYFPTRSGIEGRGLYMWGTGSGGGPDYGFNSWNNDAYGTTSFSTTAFQVDSARWYEPIPDSAGNVSWTSTSFSLRINGVSKSLSVLRGTLAERQQYLDGYYVGRGGSAAGQCMDGDIAEVLVYDRALTTAEQQEVEGYLTTKWAIT